MNNKWKIRPVNFIEINMIFYEMYVLINFCLMKTENFTEKWKLKKCNHVRAAARNTRIKYSHIWSINRLYVVLYFPYVINICSMYELYVLRIWIIYVSIIIYIWSICSKYESYTLMIYILYMKHIWIRI